ncbi:MAG: undecaprenyl-diphosphatase UppP [Moorellaceae bacterium]
MTIWQALVLGLVQGVGEFLPISSSAHLVLARFLFRWPDPGLTFDVALHLGTLVAVVAYFWRELLVIISKGLSQPRSEDGRLLYYIVLASIPGALFGVMLEEQAETVFRTPMLIALTLSLMGIGLWAADRRGSKRRELEEINAVDSILVGLSQALAIIPGVSRSGITMTAGCLLGMTRETSARFSFLMSIPIIAGAALWEFRNLTWQEINVAFAVGVITSAAVGFLAIKFLLQYLRRGSYALFAWYRFLLAALVLIVEVWRS